MTIRKDARASARCFRRPFPVHWRHRTDESGRKFALRLRDRERDFRGGRRTGLVVHEGDGADDQEAAFADSRCGARGPARSQPGATGWVRHATGAPAGFAADSVGEETMREGAPASAKWPRSRFPTGATEPDIQDPGALSASGVGSATDSGRQRRGGPVRGGPSPMPEGRADGWGGVSRGGLR